MQARDFEKLRLSFTKACSAYQACARRVSDESKGGKEASSKALLAEQEAFVSLAVARGDLLHAMKSAIRSR
jgi:hypothetical protein